nr:pyrroline-5-carboxylate reductase [Eubacterium xylanophilum]
MMLGFIGCGNMATAMMTGIIGKGTFSKEEIIAADKSEAATEKISNALGVKTTGDNAEVAKAADVLVIAVKPFHLEAAINEIKDHIKSDALIISIVAGQSIEKIEKMFGKSIKLVRTMPNTPALVLEGAAGVCFNSNITDAEKEVALGIFRSFGIAHEVPESMIDAVVGVSGSSPAYVFMFIEAMADAAVADGMPRALAYDFAAQSVLGSAKMVLETGKHPGELKDMVCSPAGTTIEAVQILEDKGLRSAVIEAQRACVKRSKEL